MFSLGVERLVVRKDLVVVNLVCMVMEASAQCRKKVLNVEEPTMGSNGCGGDGVLKEKSSGVIGESVRVMSIVDGDEEKNDDKLSLEAIEKEDDVPLVDVVLKGALGAFSDKGLCFGDGLLTSSWVRFLKSCFGGMIVIFGFLVALEVEV
ncbi:hypothetical protein Tco_1210243 [Tanacetum coccineum]